MTLWRVEWLRLVRTGRGLALLLVFGAFGVSGPVMARFLPDLVKKSSAGQQIQIVAKPATPVDGLIGYASNAVQIGLLVAVILAASALALDAKPGLAAFYRTRVRRPHLLVVPRFTVAAASAVAAYLLGAAVSWVLTVWLIAAPRAGSVWGFLLSAVYLVFAMAVVAVVATLVRGVVAVAAVTIGVLLALPVVGVIPQVGSRLPSHLVGAVDTLARGSGRLSDYAVPCAVTVLATVAAVLLAARRAVARDL